MTDVPAMEFTCNFVFDTDGRRSAIFRTYIASDCKQEELDELLDKITRSVDRQVAWRDLVAIRKNKELNANNLRQVNSELIRLEEMERAKWDESGRFGEFTGDNMSNQARIQYDGMKQAIDRYRAALAQDIEREKECMEIIEKGRAAQLNSNNHAGVSDS